MSSDVTHARLELAGAAGSLCADRWVAGGDRGALLMLHGGGQTRHSWNRAARSLAAEDWQVFTVDARGHGQSAWAPDGDYSIDGFVADFLLITEQVQRLTRTPIPPVVVGASLGGITALLGQGERGGAARALVLVDIAPRIEMAGAQRVGAFMRSAPSGFASLEEVADAVAAYQPHRRRPANTDNLRRNVRYGEDGRLYWHWDPQFLRLGDEANDAPLRHQRLIAAARRIDVPTLLVRGAMSDIVSDDGVDELLELIPAARVVDVAGAAHMVAGDDNAVFVDQMTDFLLGLPAGNEANNS
ncbi:alpha/beta fold hydrolase [Mycobacterium branderi]|uniref:Peroxidase n=1 Tax=Mycobacterium branderi TaxID=43348 RepID=A0A7I7WEN8_9MYCO|nr:alpha/beta hydrolase [Mycobacterium branderi]MCV7235203.1 alpha/beta hydrolase [Mycobacterium branderi]ORA31850.1 hypothetical protein BST20_26005 [Mycobacterium branderi]BBZ14973.1 peroxidase [Mycobacterium branderi]